MRRYTFIVVIVILTILAWKNISVSANPIPTRSDDADKNFVDIPFIPARARKAGGTLKQEYIQKEVEPTEPTEPEIILEQEQVLQQQQLQALLSSSSPQSEQLTESEVDIDMDTSTEETKSSEEDPSSYEYEYDEESIEEEECEEGFYWHIRGLRCVPRYCPGGNSKRNHDTGICFYSGSVGKRLRANGIKKSAMARSNSVGTKNSLRSLKGVRAFKKG